MTCVMDASAAAALFLPEEPSTKIETALIGLEADASLIVPWLWWYEVSNVLSVSIRRKRLSEADAMAAWNLLCALNPQTDDRKGSFLGLDLVKTAGSHGLSVYDAAYLELALRTGSAPPH